MGNKLGNAHWFEDNFGFKELSFNETQKNFEYSDGKLVSNVNGAEFHVGKFEVVSLGELKARLAGSEQGLGALTFENVVGDSQELHLDTKNAGAVFQVASQFNCLEMVSPEVRPEDGVTGYYMDGTQGPACALACPAGTVFRNYFANGCGQAGQGNQVDCLADIAELVGNAKQGYWRMENGYCIPEGPGKIGQLSLQLKQNPALAQDAHAGLRVGVHWDTDVQGGLHRVCQVFCSALPVAYCKGTHSDEWRYFACTVLRATYEATLAAAALLAAERHKRVAVYLTKVGGGVFGNRSKWILEAVDAAIRAYSDAPLDVRLVHYKELPWPEDPFMLLEAGRAADTGKRQVRRASPPTRARNRRLEALPAARAPRREAEPSAPSIGVQPAPTLAQRITAAFAKCDINCDGVIDQAEMAWLLRKLNPSFTEDDTRRIFAAADADCNGEVHYAEFAAWVTGEDASSVCRLLLDGRDTCQPASRERGGAAPVAIDTAKTLDLR